MVIRIENLDNPFMPMAASRGSTPLPFKSPSYFPNHHDLISYLPRRQPAPHPPPHKSPAPFFRAPTTPPPDSPKAPYQTASCLGFSLLPPLARERRAHPRESGSPAAHLAANVSPEVWSRRVPAIGRRRRRSGLFSQHASEAFAGASGVYLPRAGDVFWVVRELGVQIGAAPFVVQ